MATLYTRGDRTTGAAAEQFRGAAVLRCGGLGGGFAASAFPYTNLCRNQGPYFSEAGQGWGSTVVCWPNTDARSALAWLEDKLSACCPGSLPSLGQPRGQQSRGGQQAGWRRD